MSTASAALGALLVLSAGLAPGAAADDVRSQQWYLDAMGAKDLWTASTGKGIKVAVVDSGVNAATASLKGKVLADEVPAGAAYGATRDYTGHGTSMAELIAGSGAGGGLRGLAPDSRIIPVRVRLDGLTDKAEIKKTAIAAEGIRAAADTDARIINLSIAQAYKDEEVQRAVEYAAGKGKLLFGGVGNDGETGDWVEYPAAFPEVVGVSASDKNGVVAKFSQSGDYIDLASPGKDVPIWCDETFTRYCSGNGTSQATAIASASAALIWSAHPKWTAHQVLRVMIDTAARDWPKNKPSTYLGYGLIRPARNLLKGEGDPGPADVDPLTHEKTTAADSGPKSGASPSASVPTSSHPEKKTSGGGTSAAGSDSASSGDSNTLLIALGAVAAVVVVGGGGFAVARARRRG